MPWISECMHTWNFIWFNLNVCRLWCLCVRARVLFRCVFHFILSCSRCKAEQSIHTSCIATERSERFVRWSQKKAATKHISIRQASTNSSMCHSLSISVFTEYVTVCGCRFYLYIYIYIHNVSHGFCCYTFYIFFLACLRFILPIWLCSKIVQMLTYTESPLTWWQIHYYLLKHIMHRPHYLWHFC